MCPFEDDAPVRRIEEWAIACGNRRQTAPANSGTAVLLYSNVRGDLNGPTVSKACVGDTSSLLSSGGRIFLVRSSRLYELDQRSSKVTPVEVDGIPSGWRFSQLLAFAKRSSQLTLLATMIRGTGGDPVTRVWRLALSGARFQATMLADHELPADAAKFATEYVTPRCASGLESCLVVMTGSLGIRTRGQPTTASRNAPTGWVLLDAVWLKPEQGAQEMLLLAAGVCTQQAAATP